jgi:hypothetical protein
MGPTTEKMNASAPVAREEPAAPGQSSGPKRAVDAADSPENSSIAGERRLSHADLFWSQEKSGDWRSDVDPKRTNCRPQHEVTDGW